MQELLTHIQQKLCEDYIKDAQERNDDQEFKYRQGRIDSYQQILRQLL